MKKEDSGFEQWKRKTVTLKIEEKSSQEKQTTEW